MKRLISSCVLALSGTAFLSASVMAAEPASCQNVRMGVVNWTDVIATSGMADVLLTGLGYESKQTSAVQQIIYGLAMTLLMSFRPAGLVGDLTKGRSTS